MREVWPIIYDFLLDPLLRKRALEFICAWPAGDALSINSLIWLATDNAALYATPDLRTQLADTLCKKALTIRHERERIAHAIVKLLAGAPPIQEASTLLPIVLPTVVIASASRWTEESSDMLAAKNAAEAMATFQRDHLLALLRALAQRSGTSRTAIADAVIKELARPDDGLAELLASEGVPFPTTRPPPTRSAPRSDSSDLATTACES